MDNLNDPSETRYEFELFFELSLDLLCIAGQDGFFKRVNPAVSKLLGYTDAELYSKPINEFIYFEDRESTTKVREALRKSNSLLNFENRYVTRSGEIVWLSWTSLYVAKDKLVFAIARDVTAKKKLDDERNSMLVNLTKINKDLRHLSYTTSHDLRSPVHNLLSIFSLLDVSKIDDPETLEFLDILKSTGESLRQSLNNYVDILSKSDDLNADIEELNLNESLNGVLNSINSLIKNSGATINIDFSELETINFSRAYLESIFLNLITNSIKYAKPDRLAIIRIYSRKLDGVKQLLISDNGLGFDMDKVKDRIFGLRQKFHSHIDSKGVGLYLVHNHVTGLGGHIDVESKIDEGATFIISFKD